MKIIKSSETDWAPGLQRGNYGQRRKDLGTTGKLSAGLWELAPGKKSFPFHMHYATEEGLFVVSGTAQVRTPEGLTRIGPGDFVSFPPNTGAHQLINDGTEPMVYVGLGVTADVDLVDYPDTGKLGVRTGIPPTSKRWIFNQEPQVDYFAGDKDAG